MNIITAVLEVIKQFLCVKTTELSNKPVLDAIKDKRDYKKASNITEEILKITDKYVELFEKRDIRKYEKLKDKFNKFD